MEAAGKTPEYLSLVSGYLLRKLRYEARDLGIRWSALMVMTDLSLLGPSNQKTLAMIEQMTEPTMTVLLRQLQNDGMVTRKVDARDARVRLVSLTAKGRKALRRTGRILRGKLEQELVDLSAAQLGRLEEALAPLVAAIMKSTSAVQGRSYDHWGED